MLKYFGNNNIFYHVRHFLDPTILTSKADTFPQFASNIFPNSSIKIIREGAQASLAFP